ncbi:MAG TPA: HAMP domain-containing sensor histidine kinase [Aggregatilineaceae bacterium]|nr:HAMP domain-containing sensor histidine kinase [Aggregatilineaceae bacterium]
MQAPAPATLRLSDDELAQTARLLIRLRWVAGLSILLLTAVARWGLGVDLPAGALLALGVVVLGYNAALMAEARRPDRPAATARRALWGQIALDWLAMVALVHLTGGITSPALIYFVIHVALAATLLPLRGARGLALLAALIVAILAALEASGALPHIALPGLGLDGDLHRRGVPVLAALFFFSTTALTVAELLARQAEGLRQREARIRALNEARAAFSRAATHELRAPVASSLALVRSVEQGYLDELTPPQAVIIERVGARLDGLRELIDDLLDFAASREASVARPPLEPVDLGAALADAIERERPVADARNIAIHAPPREPVMVRAEDTGLSMIFSNLINNAIKYTPDGGSVTIGCAVQREAGQVTVIVQDTGIGIPAADLPRIFDEFFRASNARKSKIAGTGIGLAAVRAMVEHYRGAIALDSVEGEGTRVTVRLPLEEQRKAAKHS